MRTARLFLQLVLIAGGAIGCESLKPHSTAMQSRNAFHSIPTSAARLRSESMSLADTYVTTIAQPLDLLRAHESAQVRSWALEQKIATANAAYTDAANPNEAVALMDLLTFISLKRRAIQEHWIPVLLKRDEVGLLAAHQTSEALAWETAGRVFTSSQVKELQEVINGWADRHPTQYYVSHIRFSEFAAERAISADSAQVKVPGSIFGLLYMDPFANLDPLAREMMEYRSVIERFGYLVQRMPVLFGWEAELVMMRTLSSAEVQHFSAQTQQFTDSTETFARSVKDMAQTFKAYPVQLSTERKAAIEQVGDQFTRQHADVVKSLNDQELRVEKLLGDAHRIVVEAKDAVAVARGTSLDTIGTAEQSAQRLLRQIFLYALVLVLLLFAGLLLMIGYRNRCHHLKKANS